MKFRPTQAIYALFAWNILFVAVGVACAAVRAPPWLSIPVLAAAWVFIMVRAWKAATRRP